MHGGGDALTPGSELRSHGRHTGVSFFRLFKKVPVPKQGEHPAASPLYTRGPLASVEGRTAPAPGAQAPGLRGLSEQRAGQEGRGVEGTPHPGPGVRTRTPFLQGRRLWERGRAGVISGAGPRLPCLSPGHAEDGRASGGKATGPRRGCWKPPGGHLPLLCFQGHPPSPSRRPMRMAITTLSFINVQMRQAFIYLFWKEDKE